MAKVVGPLMSLEARGKIGNALVAFVWKGRNIMRAWTIPSNPQALLQKLIRQKLASMGKNTIKIKQIQSDLASGSEMYQLIKAKTPSTQIWNAYFVKAALDDLKVDSAYVTFEAAIAACDFVSEAFSLAAGTLGMAAITGAPYASEVSPQMQLAMGAYAAYKLNLSGKSSLYDTAPETWTTKQVTDFATAYYTDA